ncbi:zinc finger A20 and AN1 domain-containing stress-associated protein 4 isoform X1 [Capsicum chacoense]
MAEEHEVEAPEGRMLCANNCGFFGSPTTQNFCSKCYHEVYLKANQNNKSIDTIFPPPQIPPMESPSMEMEIPSASSSMSESVDKKREAVTAVVDQSTHVQLNRCSVCRKKVGLVGFKCRCGTTFCGTHRYPEIHGCSFDFKSMGREAIAKANPLVKAEKLEKI